MADSTTTTNSVITFFAELVGRLFSKTPAFFKVVQVVSAIVAIVTGLPGLLESAHIPLPAAFTSLENSIVAVGGLVALFISSLPVSTPVATSGAAVASSATLPFTAASDAKTIAPITPTTIK